MTTAASHSGRLCEQGPVDEVHRQSGRDVVFWRDISTAEPGPWILGRATHAILGGEKLLLWGEAGLGGVSPEISKSAGRALSLCPLRLACRQLASTGGGDQML